MSTRFSSIFPCVAAGFVAVLVGFASSAVVVFQAASAVGATPEQVSSWIAALCIGMALTGIPLTLKYRAPVVTAWSTPGAAVLATSLVGLPMSDAVGAFLFSGFLITLFGITGWFERLMEKVPLPIASALLAGVLLRFGLDIFLSMKTQLSLVLPMFVTYLFLKRVIPRYAIIGVLVMGTGVAYRMNLLQAEHFHLAFATPIFTMPTLSWPALLGVGLPLFIVTMASQNIPGVAAIRASGYPTPISPLISCTGIATLLAAPFGGFAINLAAITAAICMGKEAHEDPDKRYISAIVAGALYLFVGIFGATVAALFSALPKELILGLAGIALLGTIGNSLLMSMKEDRQREAALITFLITASGLSLFGIGSAFWGLVGGSLAAFITSFKWNSLKLKFMSALVALWVGLNSNASAHERLESEFIRRLKSYLADEGISKIDSIRLQPIKSKGRRIRYEARINLYGSESPSYHFATVEIEPAECSEGSITCLFSRFSVEKKPRPFVMVPKYSERLLLAEAFPDRFLWSPYLLSSLFSLPPESYFRSSIGKKLGLTEVQLNELRTSGSTWIVEDFVAMLTKYRPETSVNQVFLAVADPFVEESQNWVDALERMVDERHGFKKIEYYTLFAH